MLKKTILSKQREYFQVLDLLYSNMRLVPFPLEQVSFFQFAFSIHIPVIYCSCWYVLSNSEYSNRDASYFRAGEPKFELSTLLEPTGPLALQTTLSYSRFDGVLMLTRLTTVLLALSTTQSSVFWSICDSYEKAYNFLNFTTSLKTGDWYLYLQPDTLSWPRKHKNCRRNARYHRQVISNQPKWKICTYFRFPGLSRELPMGTRHWRKSRRLSEEDDWQNMEHSG